jgi:hypothetical protein
MDEKQKKWYQQFSDNSGGTREVFRLGCAIAIWLNISIGLYLWTNNLGYTLICIGTFFAFAFLSVFWQPAYSLLRKIFGNENLPLRVMPYKLTWWGYTPMVILLLISLFILAKGVVLIFK